MGELLEVEESTLNPLNFETTYFLVETYWFYHINEVIDLQVPLVWDICFPELDASDDKSMVPETHMSMDSLIWHMNRLWEDNRLEDWGVLESSGFELGKLNGEVPRLGLTGAIGTELVVAGVDTPGLMVPFEALGPNEQDLAMEIVGPRSEVHRVGKAATIELNGEQRRV
ncbi:hypothetical protein V6N11_084284 [Hibiscus sabdariffa]|uniref:Uncharacterized protein n=1 Tax=Hibiscus sabdariffa TaxID=183260 RepID=A0ABR2QSJ0_9ROSI